MDLIQRIDEVRARWNVLDHPFYVRWERGELSREELSHYAGQYRHAVVALAETAASAGDAEHAAEEAAHVSLWDEFSSALEAPQAGATSETQECVDAWRRDDPLEARAVLYAIEAGQPAISRTKLAGLVQHYEFEAGSHGTEYFELHAERDVEHAEASKQVLATVEDESCLVEAAELALRGNWRLLDGVAAYAGDRT